MTDALLWNEIGTIYQKMGLLDESIKAYLKASELNPGPDSAQVISNLASSYFLKKEYGRAISLYKKSLPYMKTGQEQSIIWNRIGDAYRALKDLDNAIAAYRKADELELQTLPASTNLPVNQKQPTVAEESSSVTVRSGISAAENSKSIPLPGTKPVETSRFVQSTESPVPQAPVIVAGGTRQDNDRQEPLEETSPSRAVSKVHQSGPTPAPPKNNQPQKADPTLEEILAKINVYEKIIQVNPSNHRALDTLGKLYKSIGRYQDAIAAYQRAIEFAPENDHYHYYLGLLYAVQQQHDEAIAAFEKVLQVNPEYFLAHSALAGIYHRLGMESKANQHVSAALPKMNNESAYNRACFYAICGDAELAIEFLRVALQNKDTAIDWVKTDPDLDTIRHDERYRKLLLEMEAPAPPPPEENYFASDVKGANNQLLSALNCSVAR